MITQWQQVRAPAPPVFTPAPTMVLQRTCACGNHMIAGGRCKECSKKKRWGLQANFSVNKPGDFYEQEADRIAGRMVAAPADHAIKRAPPRILRLAAQSTGQMEETPDTVNQALAGSGRPLELALQLDMEQRFGHDFSHVRVHSGAAAEKSAKNMNALAYTFGNDIVFSPAQFDPVTAKGRHLIAHELTHVMQQGGEAQLIQRAPINYPTNDPLPSQPSPKSDFSAKKSNPKLTPDDWIWMLENFRRNSPQAFVKLLAEYDGFFYPILKPYGFRGSWKKDQAYLDDFDAAVVRWGKSQIYSLRFANISQTVSQQKPKSREEQKYEYAQYLVRDMNRHGYTRGKVNHELESYGLMDDLVSHGFEKHDSLSFKDHVEYQNEAIVALNDYTDRYDAAHGNKRQTSANVPTQGEDVEFYRAWLEGLNYVTGSFFGAAFAATASKFTSDPRKITAAAGMGAAFEGVVFSVAGALGGRGSYRPEVVGPRDRPAAVGPWRYTGKQPIKPVVDPAKVGVPPAPDRIPTPDPVAKGLGTDAGAPPRLKDLSAPAIAGRPVKPRTATPTQYVWANPRMPKGNFVKAELDENGVLTVTVKSRGPDDLRRGGKQLFDDVFNHFGDDKIRQFDGEWVRNSSFKENYDEYMKNLDSMSSSEAAWNTWTGRQLKARGFNSVEVPAHGKLPEMVTPVFRK